MGPGRSTAGLVAAVTVWTVLAARGGGTAAHACDCMVPLGVGPFAVRRPRNTLVPVWRMDMVPALRRVPAAGRAGRPRRPDRVALARLGVGELWRPVSLLELGAEYEVVVGSDVLSRFTVELAVDESPPAFAGVRAAIFRRYSGCSSCEVGTGREIVIVHDPVPLDVAFLSVSVRRHGPGEAPPRQLLRPGGPWRGDRRDLTVLTSHMCGDPAPPLAIGGTYCVSVAAHDAAGNAAGGEVEVCGPVIDCRNPAWYQALQCPPPYGTLRSPDGPDEIALKDVTVPTWPARAARLVASLVAVLVLFVAWRRRRRGATASGRCETLAP